MLTLFVRDGFCQCQKEKPDDARGNNNVLQKHQHWRDGSSNQSLNKCIIKTRRCSDLQPDCKCRGCSDLTACHAQPRGSASCLLVITGNRVKFMRAFQRQRDGASRCHFQWRKPLLPPSSRKCIWNTLLTFPLLMSLFIAPVVPGPSELAGSAVQHSKVG